MSHVAAYMWLKIDEWIRPELMYTSTSKYLGSFVEYDTKSRFDNSYYGYIAFGYYDFRIFKLM